MTGGAIRAADRRFNRVCADPDCGEPISDRSRSGVCRTHNHGPFCACWQCKEKRGISEPTPPPVDPLRAEIAGTKVVDVITATTSGSFNQRQPIRLPKAPWE